MVIKLMPNQNIAMNLLVVDDEDSLSWMIRDYFQRQGFVVDVAPSKEAATSFLKRRFYSVALLDLSLGAHDHSEGLDLIGFVRSHHRGTLIVILTAFGSPQLKQLAYDLGADVFLSKPQSLSKICQIIFDRLGKNSLNYETQNK